MPSRTTRKSTRPGASDRSMVDTVQPPGLASFRDRSASPRLEDRATKMGNRLNVSHGAPQNQASFIEFYRQLKVRGKKVRVGMEASGHARWFERLLTEVQFELWIGDAAENRTKRVRKQKTDRQDAELDRKS